MFYFARPIYGQLRQVDQSLKSVIGPICITSDALIEYNPILPGQISPFKVMVTENPSMRKAGVEFKSLLGGAMSFRKAMAKAATK